MKEICGNKYEGIYGGLRDLKEFRTQPRRVSGTEKIEAPSEESFESSHKAFSLHEDPGSEKNSEFFPSIQALGLGKIPSFPPLCEVPRDLENIQGYPHIGSWVVVHPVQKLKDLKVYIAFSLYKGAETLKNFEFSRSVQALRKEQRSTGRSALPPYRPWDYVAILT